MARRIRIQNPTVNNTYKTYLDAEYTSGATLTVKSNVSFAANDIIVVGEPSVENSEDKKVDSISSTTTVTLASALNFSHNKETPVYKVLWDNVSIEGRSSSAGSWAELTQSAIQWDDKNNETIYFHTSGTDSWEYRFRFYNSVTTDYSEYSPTITGATPSRKSVQFMIDQVRQITNDKERKIVSDQEIIRFFNRAQDIIYSRNPKYWFLLVDTFKQSDGISTTASTYRYTLSGYTTFGHLDSIRFEYNDGTTDHLYHLERKPSAEFDRLVVDQNRDDDDWVECYKLVPADSSSEQGYIEVYPTPKTTSYGTFYPNYYEKMADLDTVDDTTQVPYPSLLEDYAISQVFDIKGDNSRAEKYLRLFQGPSDTEKDNQRVYGLAILDDMDAQQKKAHGQPGQLVRFRGRRYLKTFFGNRHLRSVDFKRENYF